MVQVTQDQFLEHYSRFLKTVHNKNDGSVFLTFKRYFVEEKTLIEDEDVTTTASTSRPSTQKSDTKTAKSTKNKNTTSAEKTSQKQDCKSDKKVKQPLTGEPVCLAHVKLGETDYSCVVKSIDASRFQTQFNTIFRMNTTSLVPAGGMSIRMKKRIEASKKAKNSTESKK